MDTVPGLWPSAAEHGLQGAQAELLRGTWDLPDSGIEPVFPALTTDSQPLSPQGSPPHHTLDVFIEGFPLILVSFIYIF